MRPKLNIRLLQILRTALVCSCIVVFCYASFSHGETPNNPPKRNFQYCAIKSRGITGYAHEDMICTYATASDSSLPQVNKKFLVTLHMVQDSLGNYPLSSAGLATARTNIALASDFYSRIGVSFEASEPVHLIENYRFSQLQTMDELAELTNIYGKEHRLNLFIVEEFTDDLLGACGLGGGNSIYMAGSCIVPATFAHESGHCFGLAHTFGTGDVFGDFVATDELADGSNCETAGDFICDTPADPYSPNSGIQYIDDCAFIYDGKDANGNYYDPDLGNVMGYYDESCACGTFFTDGQLRMVATAYYDSASRYSWW